MSTASRVRKSSPVKQGPMRATIPMSSLLRQNSGFRKSPTLSPTSTTWRSRTSPDNTSSGQRSPGSLTYKAKPKTLDVSEGTNNIIRRTASLDAIYLKGQWPRDSFYFHSGLLQVDKATQTEDPSSIIKYNRSLTRDPSPTQTQSVSLSSSLNDEKVEKLFRHRLQRSSKDRYAVDSATDCCISPTSVSVALPSSTTTKASPVNIPVIKPMFKPPMRSSIEGLNQEIERLVLKGTFQPNSSNSMESENVDTFSQITPPEGHRAPLADLLRSKRSVNTQTPLIPTNSSGSSCQGSSPDDDFDSDHSTYNNTPRFSTSPHINRFLAREPPDGCERVNLRFHEDANFKYKKPPSPPNVTFQLKPSLGSAFQPLKTNISNTSTSNIDMDMDTNNESV